MAIAFGTSTTFPFGTGPFTKTLNCVPGSVLFVHVRSDAATVSGVTWDGNALTLLLTNTLSPNLQYSLWYIDNIGNTGGPASGTKTIVVSGPTNASFEAVSYTGFSSCRIGIDASGETTANLASTIQKAITTANVYCWYVVAACDRSGIAPTANAAWTVRTAAGSGASTVFGDSNGVVSPGTYTPTANVSAAGASGIIVAAFYILEPGFVNTESPGAVGLFRRQVQYVSEFAPLTPLLALSPKHAWGPDFPDIVPFTIRLSTAAISASGVCHNEEFFQTYQPGKASMAPRSVSVRYQYTSEFGPTFIPVTAPKHVWAPDFPDIVPYARLLPIACISASGEFGHPETVPAFPLPKPLVWHPDYPDFAPGRTPVPLHPDWAFGFPPNQLPLNPAFMAWRPEYPDFARGPVPLVQVGRLEDASFLDAVRPAANPYGVAVYINGIDRYAYIFMSSDSIDDYLNEQPNTFKFRFDAGQSGLVINGGEDIIVEIGTNLRVGSPTRIFRGNVTESEQIALGDNAANISFNVTCSDSYLINKYKPIKRYTLMDPGLIMKDMISNFTSGYTSVYVSTGFTAVSIDFDGSDDFMTCATRLANMAGCYCFPTYYRDFAFFSTYPFTAPTAIDDANALLTTGVRNLRFLKSNTQVRTRVIVIGAGTSVDLGITSANSPYQLAAGSTTIPLSSQVPFNSAGGSARFPAQDIVYTGISSAAAKQTLSAGIPQSPGTIGAATQITTPTAGPSGNLIGPSGNMQAGTYRYKVVLVDINGEESEGSASSVTGTISTVTAPPSLSATQSFVAGNVTCSAFYLYVVSFRTSNGSTVGSAATGVSTSGVSQPTNNMLATWSGAAGNLGVGTWQYKVTFKTANGETEASNSISGVINRVSDFASTINYSLSVSGGGAANTGINGSGTYIYSVRCQDAVGETAGNTQSLTAAGYDTATVNVGAATDARVTQINLYRAVDFTGTNYKFVGSTGPGGGQIIDKFAQASLVTSPFGTTNTTGSGKMSLTNIPVSSDPRVSKRGIYRLDGTRYLHIVDIGDNLTTSYTDDIGTPDQTVAPTANTANNCQVSLTNIPTSSDPRVVGRDIWRTVAGGGGGFLHCLSIGNNTATSATDNIADADLGISDQPLVTVSTADNGVMRLTGIPLGPTTSVPNPSGGTSPITQSRRVYRTLAGGSDYRFAFSIGDNSTTTILDNTNDASLGVPMPTASTWRTRKGATQLPLEDITQISETGPGWVKAGSQVVYYTAQSGVYLTGIPASGLGSLAADVTFETQIIGMPFLKGVTGLTYALNHGDSAALKVTRNNLTAQALLSVSEGGDGVHEEVVSSSDILTDAAATIRGDAELILFALQMKGVEYETRDINTKSGALAVVTITNRNINVSLQIQHVNISRITNDVGMYPLFKVSAAPTKYTLQDLIRQLSNPHIL